MDAVCGERNWDVLLVEKGGIIVAAMPYCFIKKKDGINITQPPLTQKNGIWIRYPLNQKLTSKISFERNVIKEIIRELEKLDLVSYNQNFDYKFTNWLPFYWEGYKQYTRYTYLIEDLSDLESLFSSIDSNTRKQIRKAEKIVNVKEGLSLEEFYEINNLTFKRQKMQIPYTFEFLKKIDRACIERNCRVILYAEDYEGRTHAAIYIVWDEKSAYYLMGGADPELRNSQASTLLMWEAIKFSRSVTTKFDFEGSMIESIEKFFSSFGAVQKPYFNISKDFNQTNIIEVIAKDIYLHYPKLQKFYRNIRGK